MKTILRLLLAAAAILMVYLSYDSVMQPIRFEQQKKVRERAVIQKLIDIRTAQIEYRSQKGIYCDNFEDLIAFIKFGKMPFVMKEGVLSDSQLEMGLTEVEAAKIVRSGNQRLIKEKGLENFRRDTTYVNLLDTLFAEGYNVDELDVVPYGNGAKFEMQAGDVLTGSGILVRVFEAKVPYETFMEGLDRQEVTNMILTAEKMEKYPGLRVGNIFEANNNAGNWE